ncbi:MAG: glycoside hydrolase family 43 protein [Janthinobacterium lividum]
MKMNFIPGNIWQDTDGKPIQAHGGGLLYDRGTYYWYGENKDAPNIAGKDRVDVCGVSCYSSQDLLNWKDAGLVLPAVPDDPTHDLYPARVAERPKVIWCPATGQYVLWLHVDSADYQDARTGVAVSASPTGPFEYVGSFRPNGYESRDMTVFSDTDGAAYLFYSSDNNKTLRIARLSDDYLSVTADAATAFEGQSREAPAVFVHNGTYYMLSSGCSGWLPNQAEWASAPFPLGPWTTGGNPCAGEGAETTFGAQSTFVLPVAGKEKTFIALFDRWSPYNLQDSRYVWLPIEWDGPHPIIRWRDEWDGAVLEELD